MGTIDRDAALSAADRYNKARGRQRESTSVETEATMWDRRRDFLVAAERVFLESVIEGSDLIPVRFSAPTPR